MDEVCERSMDSKNRRHTEVLVIQLKQSKAKQIKAIHLETDSNMFY